MQALARENDPSQVAGPDAFKNKDFEAIIAAARQSNEVYEAVTADPDNLDTFLQALAHMILAAKSEGDYVLHEHCCMITARGAVRRTAPRAVFSSQSRVGCTPVATESANR